MATPPDPPCGSGGIVTRTRGRLRAWGVPVAIVLVVALVSAWLLRPHPAATRSVVHVAAAGALSCSPNDPGFARGRGTATACGERRVSALVASWKPDAFLGLGDYQYEEARADDYATVFDASWGRVRSVTRPALGNQEFKVHDANTFRSYYGARAPADPGWYAYDLGPWRAIVLNSNCSMVRCDAASAQARWLRQELATAGNRCVVTYWHHPRFSTGLHGSDDRLDALWRIVATRGKAIVVTGHEHDYERLTKVDANGNANPAGIRSFVVGTGGQAVFGPNETTGNAGQRRAQARSDVRIDDRFGALRLALRSRTYAWQFVATDGQVLDSGSEACR